MALGTRSAGCSSDSRISFRLIRTAANDAALTRNADGVPTAAMTRPATAGPAILARLNTALFSPIAFGRSLRPTISTANACRVGLSTTVARPSANASAYTCQICTVPVSASTPRISARPPMTDWVTIRILRLE